jgi:hypothetical protein
VRPGVPTRTTGPSGGPASSAVATDGVTDPSNSAVAAAMSPRCRLPGWSLTTSKVVPRGVRAAVRRPTVTRRRLTVNEPTT